MISQKKVIHIVAGGPLHLIPDLHTYNNDQVIWMGVDRGVHYLLEAGIMPEYSIGDFDSVTNEEWSVIAEKVPKINRVHPEKDETDMELAFLWATKQKPTHILIFGATGGRLDHFMANALLMYQFQTPNIKMHILDIQNEISLCTPGSYTIKRDEEKKYVSFIPLSLEVVDLTLRGFKYPLSNKLVKFGSSLCISNELIQQSGTFSFESGILMMIRSTDLQI